MIDARPLRLIRRYPVRSRDRARVKSQPCTCPGAHASCKAVICQCGHGIAGD